MEMVAVVSPSGIPTGAIVSRNEAHSKGLWHSTVHIWIRNRAGELLLQKRSATKESHPGLWDISCAGHVSAGDSSRDAAVRELREELGISINSSKLTKLFSLPQRYENCSNCYYDNEIVDVYLCSVPVEREEIVVDRDEVSDVAYYPVNELKNKMIEDPGGFVPHEEEYRRLFEEMSLIREQLQ
jgi:isopentenyl-diphosphate Delta-isomerase